MLKDLLLAQAAAKESGAVTTLGANATAIYERFQHSGHGNKDYSAIVAAIREG